MACLKMIPTILIGNKNQYETPYYSNIYIINPNTALKKVASQIQ